MIVLLSQTDWDGLENLATLVAVLFVLWLLFR